MIDTSCREVRNVMLTDWLDWLMRRQRYHCYNNVHTHTARNLDIHIDMQTHASSHDLDLFTSQLENDMDYRSAKYAADRSSRFSFRVWTHTDTQTLLIVLPTRWLRPASETSCYVVQRSYQTNWIHSLVQSSHHCCADSKHCNASQN